MSSIRPLITITILVAVGVFLFTKINDGPVPLPPEMENSLEQASAVGVPPLAADSSSTLAPAPAWSDPSSGASTSVAAIEPTPSPTTLPTATVEPVAPQTLTAAPADLPPIPELPPVVAAEPSPVATTPVPLTPPVATTTPATATAPGSATTSIPLPANIPVAQYPGDAAAPAPETIPMTPPSALDAQPTAQSANQLPLPATAEAAMPIEPAALPSAPGDDRYRIASAEPPMATPSTTATSSPAATASANPIADPSTPTFSSVWPDIQAALDRQELVAAHAMLSRWYGNPNLTPAEAQQIESLLSQLAGTVVYSTEHRLEPPYTVHAGDTLQTIAQQYEVPWQLLAKINGIAAANMVQPGQQLKVVHGPFSATVELDKSQLTLMLDGRYAGRFPISIEEGASLSEGRWVLEQKLVQPTTQDSTVVSASYAPSAVDHVLVLRNESPTASGATISITGGKSAPSGPTAVAPAAIRLSPRDVEEVADILSVGSPVTIRR
jgi:LysM repeat protein